MKKSLILLSILFSHYLSAQNLNISNQHHFGGAQDEFDTAVIPSPLNDGYFFIGQSNSNISGDKTENSRGGFDVWIRKTDLNFNVLWDKTIGGSMDENVWDAKIENNKIYISTFTESGISGEKTSANIGSLDIWLLCLDLNGNILWQNQYGGIDEDLFASIVADYKPNSLLLAGTSRSPISGNKSVGTKGFGDIWLIEINKADGQIINQKGIGTTSSESYSTALKSSVNNHLYLVCITTSDTISGDKTDPGFGPYGDIWLIELDQNLTIIKDKCFGGTDIEQLPALYEIDNHLFISGQSNSNPGTGNKTAPNHSVQGVGFYDGWLVKIDYNFNILWDQSYGGFADERFSNVFQNANGNLVLSMISSSIPSGNKTAPRFGTTFDVWLVITDGSGNIVAQETYGGLQSEGGIFYPYLNSSQDLLMLSNSASGISGNKTVPSHGARDVWIAKINAANFLNTEKIVHSESTISVYPNPFSDQVNFDFGALQESAVLTLFTPDGKKVFETKIDAGNSTFTWSPENNDAFLIYHLDGNSIHHVGKIAKR